MTRRNAVYALLWLSLGITAQAEQEADLIPQLEQRVAEIRSLLTTLEQAIEQLEGVAERALNQAEQANDFDIRSRYENLYAETNIRIGELRLQHEQLAVQLGQFEQQLLHLRQESP